MNLSTFLLNMSSTAAADSTTAAGGGNMTLMIVVLMVFMVGYMYFISRKEKKKQQAETDMREGLKIGDEIMTIGGIMGRVVTVKEDSVIIETGADRTKIRFTKQAIARNITSDAKAEEAKNARVEAAKKAAEEKRSKKK